MEELSEETETTSKLHEALGNPIRQTVRCEPFINFNERPGETPLRRLRTDAFENHVAGKISKWFKVADGSDAKDIARKENLGVVRHSFDVEGLKDISHSSTKGITGQGRCSQPALDVPPGVAAVTEAGAKDLQKWATKILPTKCDKCSEEYLSPLNCRRHERRHRRSMNPEKEDFTKERSKVAGFWDRLTPEAVKSIVHYENMEIEGLSGQAAFQSLSIFIEQTGLPPLPHGILKAGALLLDIIQNKSSVLPMPSERLLSILDDASERTFLSSGTSITAQRFAFHGGAAKIGLDDKNVVACMGFHVESNLVKAWMADKEAEALRLQQALFREEEDEQEKKAKVLAKKRMKKVRQRGRKASTSTLILHELENESIDDKRKSQGIGEEDVCPVSIGSSSSSLPSAQALSFCESSELDVPEGVDQRDARDGKLLGFAKKRSLLRNKSVLEDELDGYEDGHFLSDEKTSQPGSHWDGFGTLLGRKEGSTSGPSVEESVSHPLNASAKKISWDGITDARLANFSRAVAAAGNRRDASAVQQNVADAAHHLIVHEGGPLHRNADCRTSVENKRECSPKDGSQGSLLQECLSEGMDHRPRRPALYAEPESESLYQGVAESSSGTLEENEVEAALLSSHSFPLPVSLEDAGEFLRKRWCLAEAKFSMDEKVELATEAFPTEAEEINFLDIVSLQLSNQRSGTCPAV